MKSKTLAAFTVFDVVILFGTVFLLFALFTLAQRPRRGIGCGYKCISNQKQIALAFRLWSNDHHDHLPMNLSQSKGGAMESALSGDPLPSFLAISNELNSPKILLCPQDFQRGPRAMTFDALAAVNISYSIGVDAAETNPASILSADRNLVFGDLNQPRGLLTITNWKAAIWSRDIHDLKGNIALADGSAHQVAPAQLQQALKATGLATNRFAVP